MMQKNKLVWVLTCLLGLMAMSCDSEESVTDPIDNAPIDTNPETDPSLEGTIKEQYETDIDIYYAVKDAGYTIDEPYINLNPYGVAPLSAYVAFETEEEVSITVTVKSNGKSSAISHEYTELDTLHFVPVYGLYENHDNQVTITTSNGDENTISIQTSTVQDAPEADIITSETSQMADGFTFVISSQTEVQAAFDSEGYLRHAFTNDIVGGGNHFFKAENGNFICSNGDVVKEPYYRSYISELNAMGKILAQYEIATATHHDVRELPNGNLLVATNETAQSGSEDVVIEIDRESGNTVKTWNIEDYLPKDAGSSLLSTNDDWFHNNSVYYDDTNDQIILSGRHRDAVIAIDYFDDKLNWVFGSPDGWDSSVADYMFTATGNNFEWQWGQHSAIVTDKGDLFLFDNGNNRSKSRENAIDNIDNYSRAVIYSLDTENMEASQSWQFGKSRGYDFFSSYISEVNYIEDNHYIVISGAVSSSTSNRPGNGSSEKAVIVEIVNDVVVFEMEIDQASYRIERTNPYSDNNSQFLEKGIAY